MLLLMLSWLQLYEREELFIGSHGMCVCVWFCTCCNIENQNTLFSTILGKCGHFWRVSTFWLLLATSKDHFRVKASF